MHWSEVKLLLSYLVYNCEDAKTYFNLALTCKYTAELVKYYKPMKMKQFCKQVKWGDKNLVGGEGILYILPNGRVLKSESCAIGFQEAYKSTDYYDVNNNTVIFDDEETANFYANEMSYFLNNKQYRIDNNSLMIDYKTGKNTNKYELSCLKCCYCNQYHSFLGYLRNAGKYFNISSYCGLPLKYFSANRFLAHEKRRKIVHAVIQYSKKLKNK